MQRLYRKVRGFEDRKIKRGLNCSAVATAEFLSFIMYIFLVIASIMLYNYLGILY